MLSFNYACMLNLIRSHQVVQTGIYAGMAAKKQKTKTNGVLVLVRVKRQNISLVQMLN